MKKILIFVDYFLPGFKAGGPIQSIKAILTKLQHDAEFVILTTDRDAEDVEPYPSISYESPTIYFGAKTFYLKRGLPIVFDFYRHLKSAPDVIYLNSFFSFWFSILPLITAKLFFNNKFRIVLAPRGELSEGALSIKSKKKRKYIALTRFIGFYKNIVWHATSAQELEDIKKIFGKNIQAVLASNLKLKPQKIDHKTRNDGSRLKGVYLSRISPKKNIHFLLEVLYRSNIPADFDIYGPVRDEKYWQECQALIERYQLNNVRYCGEVLPEDVHDVLARYDFFLFPTLSENFGHVIIEALSAGLLPIISDQTPWNDLESYGIGWSLPLSDSLLFASKLAEISEYDESRWLEIKNAAIDYADRYLDSKDVLMANKQLFDIVE